VRQYPWKFSGIAGNGGVDLKAPAVDPAGHALTSAHALLAEPVNHVQTADAVVAVDDQRSFIRDGFEPLELSGNGPHGDQLGVRDAGKLEFGGLTNVDKEELFTGGEAALDVLRCGFERE
jgi:hypothetical protein